MNVKEERLWRMTCMDALMSRAHGYARATLDKLEGML